MRDIPINLFKGRHPSTFIKFVNLINRLDRDGKGCYAKDVKNLNRSEEREKEKEEVSGTPHNGYYV